MTTIIDRTDHNKFSDQQQQRYVEQRLRELNAFEVRASGLANPFFNTATTAARVATPPTGALTMNVHQTDTLSRPKSLFQPAENTSAYLKSGFLGFQGSGKTLTLSLLAIGLVLHMRKKNIEYANRPVFFLDTETGSDWVKPFFDEMGVELEVAKTRAFVDLIEAIDEAKKAGAFLIVDSVTHFWTELTSSYARAKAKQLKIQSGIYRLQFQDWAFLKGDQGWQKFTDRYVNSPLHMGVGGRAGFEYDYFEDEEGKKQLEKTGVKMKAEGEFGFEPSLLVQMEVKQRLEGKTIAKVWREARVIKDRSTLIDGHSFFFTPEDDDGNKLSTHDLVLRTFRAFQPHINRLNLGGKQLGVDIQRTSEHVIPSDRRDWSSTHRKVAVAELEALLFDAFPGQTKDDKIGRAALIRKHFGDDEMTWTRIEEVVSLVDVRHGYDSMYREVKGKPSQYAGLFDPALNSTEMDDDIPETFAPLKDITLSAQALATPLVKAALQDAAAGPEDDGIPVYLKRQTEPAVTPLAPAEPEIDEPKFLAEVTKALEDCLDFVSFGHAQQTLLNPNRSKVSAPTWEKANRLMRKAIKRLTEVEVPGAVMATAAE